MFGIVITGHGSFANGLQEAIELCLGVFKDIKYITYREGDTLEIFKEKLKSSIDELPYEDILLITDIQKGTPYNISTSLKETLTKNIEILYGCNLPMIIEAIEERNNNSNFQNAIENIINSGKNGIGK